MKILELTSDYLPNPLWGMGWHVAFLVEELKKTKNLIYVGTASKSRNIHDKIITSIKKNDVRLLANKPHMIFDDFQNFLLWQKELANEIIKRNIQFDLVHCHNWMSWITAKELKKYQPDIKIVSTIHFLQKQYDFMSDNPTGDSHKEIIDIEYSMLSESDQIIIQSQSQMDLIKSGYDNFLELSKVNIIHSGVNHTKVTFEELRKAKEKNDFIDIVFIGRVEKDKGINQLLEAFSILKEKYKNIRLNILGDGPILNDLIKKYKSKYILFKGFVSREILEKCLIKSHIFCLPSYSESFGNSIIEAMNFGLVPIFSKGTTIPDLFREGIDGLKVKLYQHIDGNAPSVEDIVIQIEKLILNKKRLNDFSFNSYKYSTSKYSMENMVSETIKVFENVLNKI